jgi:hypothetical protein
MNNKKIIMINGKKYKVNKSKILKNLLAVSMYVNYLLAFYVMASSGILGKIWDYITIIY